MNIRSALVSVLLVATLVVSQCAWVVRRELPASECGPRDQNPFAYAWNVLEQVERLLGVPSQAHDSMRRTHEALGKAIEQIDFSRFDSARYGHRVSLPCDGHRVSLPCALEAIRKWADTLVVPDDVDPSVFAMPLRIQDHIELGRVVTSFNANGPVAGTGANGEYSSDGLVLVQLAMHMKYRATMRHGLQRIINSNDEQFQWYRSGGNMDWADGEPDAVVPAPAADGVDTNPVRTPNAEADTRASAQVRAAEATGNPAANPKTPEIANCRRVGQDDEAYALDVLRQLDPLVTFSVWRPDVCDQLAWIDCVYLKLGHAVISVERDRFWPRDVLPCALNSIQLWADHLELPDAAAVEKRTSLRHDHDVIRLGRVVTEFSASRPLAREVDREADCTTLVQLALRLKFRVDNREHADRLSAFHCAVAAKQ